MTKADLIDAVHAKAEGLSKKSVGEIVDAVFDAAADAIRDGGRFSYPGFGTFTVKESPEREGRNPQTGAAMQIKASKSVRFKPAPKFKDSL
ncbi:MAG: HU family DNA-binding protein [Myxococcales bacterium]|nr:HU family DNA-binding protein [Myxococcales bacterium]MCB9533419.1 HU family DNA-binding protein [Myxococcales bacterium]